MNNKEATKERIQVDHSLDRKNKKLEGQEMTAFIQGTKEWLEFRKNKIGSSDASIVMGVSPWKTKYKLWEEKVGLDSSCFLSFPMKRGIQLEEKARLNFEQMTGLFVLPDVIVHPKIEWMIASLDGIDVEKKHFVEIKCPGKKDHELAKKGKIPTKYYPQLQHQLEVCHLEMGYYFSFDGQEGTLLEIRRDDNYIKKMVSEEGEFWDCIQNFIPPKMTDRDFEPRIDTDWIRTAEEWLSTNQKLADLKNREEELKDRLISLSQKKSSIGGGIKLTRIMKKGSVDYSKIPELKKVNLESFRKQPIEYWKVFSVN